MAAIGQDIPYSGHKTIDGSIGARLSPRASGKASSKARVKEAEEKSHHWDREKASSLERAWNSKFAKQAGEQLAVSPSVPRSPRAVTCSTPKSSPLGFTSITHAPTLSLFAGARSFSPADEVFTDKRAKDFPVWSSYQNIRKYSPRGVSVPNTRPRLVTAELARGTTTGYLMPPSNGGLSLDRFLDNTPGVTQDRSLPIGLRALTPVSRDDATMPEHLWRLHRRRLRLAQDYPTSLTARAAYSDLAIASRTAPAVLRSEHAAAEARLDAQERDIHRVRECIKAERKFVDRERNLYGLSPRGDFRFLQERRRMLAADLHLTDQQLRDAVLLKTDPRWPGPSIWTERGKAVYDTITKDAILRGIPM